MRRVGKGFSEVEMTLFEGMLVAGEPEEQGDVEKKLHDNVDDATQEADTAVLGDDEALDACVSLTRRVEHLEHDKVAQALEITKLKKRRIESSADTDMEDASNQRRMIADLDRDTGVALMDDEGTEKKAEDAQVASDEKVKGRDPEEESTAIIPAETKSKDKGKGIMDSDWSVAIDHVKQKAKEDSYVQRYRMMKKRPQTEAQARRNMIMYLKNVAGFRLDYFKGMTYDDIRLIFEAKFNANIEFLLKLKEQLKKEENRAIESIN
nr:hypothetical protein [Tanacetum cinerariifolium]